MTPARMEWKAYSVYTLVAVAVLLPMLGPGFILTLDLVFTPSLPIPENVTNSYLFHVFLHLINVVVPSDIIEKILLASIVLLSCIGMHRLIRFAKKRTAIDWGVYVGSIFFAINPFTYSRFMAGQYIVLLGYALLPWFVRVLLVSMERPSVVNALKLGGLAALIGMLSIHTLAAIAVLVVVGGIIAFARKRWERRHWRFSAIVLATFVLLSSYWILPLIVGQGKTADTIANFTAADAQAFATTGDNVLERAFNVLHLQGFWAEAENMYLMPQERTIAWDLLAMIILGLAVVGVLYWWNKRRLLVLWFGTSALIGILMAAGILGPWITQLPLLQGLREPHKLTMLVALGYSLFLAIGIDALLGRLSKKSPNWYNAAVVSVIALPFLYMRVMFWGFDGQLTPRHYPADWLQANTVLQQTDSEGEILFLPWHHYMSFQFAGRIIASPAPAFFGERIVISQDPERDGAISSPPSERQRVLDGLLKTDMVRTDFSEQLAANNIRFILLAKELDYQKYDFLDTQPGLTVRLDLPSVTLYENRLWRQGP